MNEIDLYDYELPRDRIAQHPLPHRSDSRLMIVRRDGGTIDHHHVRDLPDLLDRRDTLVVNNSRVVPARLVGFRQTTGGKWQGLFLRHDPGTGVWEVLTKTRGTLRSGETIVVQDRDARDAMELTVVGRSEEGGLLVKPQPPTDRMTESELDRLRSPLDWLARFGRIPLPPYIRDGQMVDEDIDRYQTVYARPSEGASVAAPTAGLHFTPELLEKVRAGGVATAEVTLHVGIGTFRPISSESLDDHRMHREWGQIDAPAVNLINERRGGGGRTIAVGTTSVRVLESAAASGGGTLAAWSGETDLFIRPPFQFNAVDALMTNFHLPKSTLLVMISAMLGRELTLHAYEVAVNEEYRFFSYGDAMLIV